VSTRRTRSSPALAWALALTCTTLAACSPNDVVGEGVGSGASCAAMINYRGHSYWGGGELRRDPARTGRLVTGAIPGCDDTGGQLPPPSPESVQVAELADVPLRTALWWAGTVYVRTGRQLPAWTRLWFRAPRCLLARTFSLRADWLGVTGPNEPRFDGDLRPPYRLSVHVTDGPEEYVGATVQVHADTATEPGLGPVDVKASLWKGGEVTARVRCVDGRFRAVSLVVPPST
jgi:predicted small secreted protein